MTVGILRDKKEITLKATIEEHSHAAGTVAPAGVSRDLRHAHILLRRGLVVVSRLSGVPRTDERRQLRRENRRHRQTGVIDLFDALELGREHSHGAERRQQRHGKRGCRLTDARAGRAGRRREARRRSRCWRCAGCCRCGQADVRRSRRRLPDTARGHRVRPSRPRPRGVQHLCCPAQQIRNLDALRGTPQLGAAAAAASRSGIWGHELARRSAARADCGVLVTSQPRGRRSVADDRSPARRRVRRREARCGLLGDDAGTRLELLGRRDSRRFCRRCRRRLSSSPGPRGAKIANAKTPQRPSPSTVSSRRISPWVASAASAICVRARQAAAAWHQAHRALQ